MNEFFYDFTLDGANRGYSYLLLDASALRSVTRFRLEDDAVFTNVFELKLGDGEVLACRHGANEWVDLSTCPVDHFPGCAYPLLLPRALSKPYTYVQISDDDGSVIGPTHLQCEGWDIVESREGITRRRFTMDGETPTRIDWGGAISNLHDSPDACVRGSRLEFVIDWPTAAVDSTTQERRSSSGAATPLEPPD